MSAILTAIAAAGVLLVSCASETEEVREVDTAALAIPQAAPKTTPDTGIEMDDNNILAKLSAMDSMEIDLGRLATQKAENPDVRAYAEMLIAEHTQSREECSRLATELNLTPVLAPHDDTPVKHAERIGQLSGLEGPGFDEAYLNVMIEDHRHALDTLPNLAANAKLEPLRMHIEKGLAKVGAHRQQAIDLQSKLRTVAAK
jgi:putative membrane protein